MMRSNEKAYKRYQSKKWRAFRESFLKENPNAKQVEIAAHIGKSERTVKRLTPILIKRGLLEREKGKRNGKWIVNADITKFI